jgi:hypothetical protein
MESKMKKRTHTSIIYRIAAVISLQVALMMICTVSFAQTLPECEGGTDPFGGPCPVDSWVFILVIIAVCFTACRLSKGKPETI